MKKVFIIMLCCFFLAGCSSKYSIDFNDKIDTKIEFSFSKSEFKERMKDDSKEVEDEINAIISEVRPLTDSYEDMFEEVSNENNGYSYSGEYSYSYTYSNFVNNAILNRCFEFPVIEEDDNKIYVYLSGKSECAPFDLRVKADNRMVKNNADSKKDNVYIWEVKESNNDIQFNISKVEVKKSIIKTSHIIYIGSAIIIALAFFFLKKKGKL